MIRLKTLPKEEKKETISKSGSGCPRNSQKTTPYEKWKQGENRFSIRKSVNAKCYDCVGGERYTSRIRFCAVFGCPLWFVRPYRKGITQEMCKAHVEYGSAIPSKVTVKKRITIKKK